MLLLLMPLAGPASAAALPPLLAADELAARLDTGTLRVIDIRAGEEAAYVPGAVAAPYVLWRGPADNPGRPPDPAALSALLQRLGIDASTPVVVVHEGEASSQ